MALLEEWHKIAYNDKADQGELQRFWQHYFLLEKGVYEKFIFFYVLGGCIQNSKNLNAKNGDDTLLSHAACQ